MSSELEQIEQILRTEDYKNSFEVVSLALSIKDAEDRDLQLLDIIHWLLKNDDWQKSHGIAQLVSDGYEKSEALRIIAEKTADAGHLERALFAFSEAENNSKREVLLDWQKAELLHEVAKSLQKYNAGFKAEEIWKNAVAIAQNGENSPNAQDSLDCSSVLAEIAEYFAKNGKFQKALEVANKIKNIGKRERIVKKLSEQSDQIQKVA